MRIVLSILVVIAIIGSYYFFMQKKKVETTSSDHVSAAYYIGKEKVDEKKFLELKNVLVVEINPVYTTNFEVDPGVFGGTEMQYRATRKEGGKEYLYSIMNFADGHVSYSIISE